MVNAKNTYDVIIIGAGAAGIMCAIRAGQRGRKVLVIDHADRAGSKILISGGGRCNFTNLKAGKDTYVSENPHFCLSALNGFTPDDFLSLVKKHKIDYHEKTAGQLFCDGSAKQIVDMLVDECPVENVQFRFARKIVDISKPDVFCIRTDKESVEAPALVLATGGLSIPKMGATDFAHRIAGQFGIHVTKTRPGLVPLIFEGETKDLCQTLSGVSLPVAVACGKKLFCDQMIFTHKGLSGPAILQISSYWSQGQDLVLDLLPDLDAEEFLLRRRKQTPKVMLKTALGEVMPHRLAQIMAEKASFALPLAAISNADIKRVEALLKKWTIRPAGTEGYAKAEVTIGGISTQALSSKTMETTIVPNLFFVGEAVDVTGWLGGYNLQWAWSSGWAAGSFV